MTTTLVRPEPVHGATRTSRRRPDKGGSQEISGRGGRIVALVLLIAFAVASVVPMIWLILAPSKTSRELTTLPPLAFGSFEGYGRAWQNLLTFQDGVLLQWLWNSVWYTGVIVAISCVTALLAGYALAVAPIPFRRGLLILTLVAMIVPPVALVIPLFIEVSALGMHNSPWAIILVSSFYPFGVFLAYIHFSSSIPSDLYEAARMDGNGEFGTFLRVALPLSKGLIGMLAFFSFTGAWINYFLPFVLLSTTATYTLPVGLGVLFSSTPALNPAIGASLLPIGKPEIALAGLITAVPILTVFLVSSRFLVRGVLSGSVKS